MAHAAGRAQHGIGGGVPGVLATRPDCGRRAAWIPTMSAEKLAEIRKMYFEATPKTIQRDLDRAIDILKSLKDDEERSKAAVFMEGLNELRKEWKKR
jgi:hypothetical protein